MASSRHQQATWRLEATATARKDAARESAEGDSEKVGGSEKDPSIGDEQRKEMQKKAEMLAQMLAEARSGGLNREKWEELANADEMRAMMEALAAGEPIPDSTWNRVLSTLDAGLWQVRGRTPPEDYRKQIEQYQDLLRRFVDEEVIDAK
ncbi:MAG: hypothetical protein O3C40_37845 [Planctomycetota bacterium]|nr:hypothetical protein [Planctomycetota bacterium]